MTEIFCFVCGESMGELSKELPKSFALHVHICPNPNCIDMVDEHGIFKLFLEGEV